MNDKIYRDADVDDSILKGKTIAIIGYGSQGHAQAQNLRDSGCNVVIGQRPGGPNYDLAVSHGFKPVSAAEAAEAGDLINILLPDELQGDVYRNDILPRLKPGKLLMCSHGFNVHFNQVVPPKGIDIALVAPKGPGHLVRSEYVKGAGVPTLIALTEGASDQSRKLALAYAKGIGGTRGGVIETTFAEETETDLFGEQVVLCGGVSALVKAGYETLVEAGYQPEMAYFECMHELKLIVDLMYEGGIAKQRWSVSDTAEYGDYVSGPRIIDDSVKARMQEVLGDIKDGTFAARFIADQDAGAPEFKRLRAEGEQHPIEATGRELRGLMAWVKSSDDYTEGTAAR